MNKVEIEIRGKKLTLETGKLAKQADGAVVAQFGDTVVLATAVADKNPREGLDFFPLTVDYQEKAYSAGKIPGGFFKREGRPSEKEILTSRLIDRPIRPFFPKGFYCETQCIVNVLSYGDENIADILGIISMSAALTISNIPFKAPIAAVRIGRIDGSFIINPDLREVVECDINLVVAGTEDRMLPTKEEAQRLIKSIPNCTKVEYPSSGHFVLDERVNLTQVILDSHIFPQPKYDPILDWKPPSKEYTQQRIEERIKPLRLLAGPVFFSTDENGKRHKGLSRLPSKETGPLLFVANHQFGKCGSLHRITQRNTLEHCTH